MTMLQSLFIVYTYVKVTVFKSTSFEEETDLFYQKKLYILYFLKMIQEGLLLYTYNIFNIC